MGFHLNQPRFSWIVEDSGELKPKAEQISVAFDQDFTQICWNSTEDSRLSNLGTFFPIELKPYQRYFWKVRVIAQNGESAESDVQWFETAKMEEGWEAEWITNGRLEAENAVFIKDFYLEEKVTDARIYISGLGLYEVFINGEKVGNEFLAPGCNDYERWIQYQTYAVNFRKGENRITVSVGNGWYRGKFGLSEHTGFFGRDFRCILEIRKKGKLILATDESWRVKKGSVLGNNIYDGEIYAPAQAGNVSYPVTVLQDDKEKLMARLSLPVVVKEERKPVKILHTPNGEDVLDMGQNFAGFLKADVHEPSGKVIRFQFGEILQDGSFYRDNLRTARQEYVYYSDGKNRTIRAHFTYYGFRYVKIEGISDIELENFTGCVLYSDLEQAGYLVTGHEKINRLIQNALWGQKSNYVDVPTDCPQRDERMGWTGDAQMFAATACFQMNSYAFLNKYLYDMQECQKHLGYVPSVIPAIDFMMPACSAWGDAATILPWTMYCFYGDSVILEQQFESMKQWVDTITQDTCPEKRLWNPEFTFGDWLALDHENLRERMVGGTDNCFLSSAYYYYSTSILAKTSVILGKKKEADYYANLANEIKEAIQKEYLTVTGRLAITTQTAYVLAIYMDLLPEDGKKRACEMLHKKLLENDGYLKTGFVGTAYICRTLSENGYERDAYRLLFNEDHPSWLYAVNLGATTIWERWNSLLPDGTINGTDMNSFNHYAYGAIVEWMYRTIAGINPVEEAPGFSKVVIRPIPEKRLKRADMSYQSASGVYKVSWELKNNGCVYKIKIPYYGCADIMFPHEKNKVIQLKPGEYTFEF